MFGINRKLIVILAVCFGICLMLPTTAYAEGEDDEQKFLVHVAYNDSAITLTDEDIFEITLSIYAGEETMRIPLNVSSISKEDLDLRTIYGDIPDGKYVINQIKYIGPNEEIANLPYACDLHAYYGKEFGLSGSVYFAIYIGEDAVNTAIITWGEKNLMFKGMLGDRNSPSRDLYESASLAEAGEFVTEPTAPGNNIFTTEVPGEKTTEEAEDKYDNYFSNNYNEPQDVPSELQNVERKENGDKKTNVISVVLVIMLLIVSGIGAIIRYLDSKNQK